MNAARVALSRLLASVRSRRMDRELRDEIHAHLAEAADDYVRRGLSPDEARLAALRSFGGVAQTEEVHREMRSFAWLSDLRQDVRHTCRTFVKNPAFTVVAVLTLSLGIGATTAIFSLLDAVVFRPLPVPAARELVTFYENASEGTPDTSGGTGRFLRFSYDRFERLQRALGADGSIAAFTRTSFLAIRLPGDAERHLVGTQFVSGGFFGTLGIQAARGRVFEPDDARLDRVRAIAVVSDGFWRRRLGGTDDALGRTIAVNDVAVTIVGIAPRGFGGLWTDRDTDLWLPISLQQPAGYQNNSSTYSQVDMNKPWMTQPIGWLNLVARLPRGDTRAVLPRLQAANHDGLVELAGLMQNPKGRLAMLAHTLAAEPLAQGFSGLRGRFSDALFVLTGVVTLVLLVTCANIANLLLARAASRAHETRIRLSLGASTWRLIRQCLTESFVLALLGGAGGVLFSRWASETLARQVIGNIYSPLPMVFSAGARAVVFAAGVSIAAALVFGLVPALRAIAAGRRAAAGGHQRQPVASTLPGMRTIVVAQLALAVVLASAAVIFGRTLVGFMRIDPGFDSRRLVTVSFDPITSGYASADGPLLTRRVVAAARSVPGVVSAAASTCGLIANCSSSGGFLVEGAGPDGVSLARNWIGAEYFATVGIPLASGREFTELDRAGSPRVAIVNEALVRRYFPGQHPVGRRLGMSALDTEIVGVARDARTQTLHDAPVPTVYFPIEQIPFAQGVTPPNDLDVRVTGDPAAVEARLRPAIRDVDPKLLVADVGVMSRRLSRDLTRERVVAYLAFAFGALTLLLAGIGLYGVLAFGVARRTQEIGVRMALGARRPDVLALIVGQTARLAAIGLAFGLLAAWGASRALSNGVFGATSLDVTTVLLVTFAFGGVIVLASYLPARRATNVDPLVALRYE